MKQYIIILLTIISCTSCMQLNVSKIEYNQQNNWYNVKWQGKTLVLRTDTGTIVTPLTYRNFLASLASNGFYYNYALSVEESELVNIKYFNQAINYAQCTNYVISNKSDSVLISANKLINNYPKAIYFTNILYFKAQAFEQLGNTDSAMFYYKQFIGKSSQLYSNRFWGNFYNVNVEYDFNLQRNCANAFIQGNAYPKPNTSNFSPKYYYKSFSPGYTLNPHDSKGKNYSYGFWLNYSNTGWLVGTGLYLHGYKKLYVAPSIIYGANFFSVKLALPFQVYQSVNNRVGIKVSPIIVNNWHTFTGTTSKFDINYGLALSAAYCISPQLVIAAYGRVLKYNNNKPYNFENNEIELSTKYFITRNFAFKTALLNIKPILGVSLGNTDLMFDFTNKALLIRGVFD